MRNREREEDLRISSSLVGSEHGRWLKEKINELVLSKQKEEDSYGLSAEVEKLFLHKGIKMGLEMARDLPERIRKDSDKVMANMIKKIMGDQE